MYLSKVSVGALNASNAVLNQDKHDPKLWQAIAAETEPRLGEPDTNAT